MDTVRGVIPRGEKLVRDNNIIGLIRNDIKYIRIYPIVERFDIKAGDISKFYFYNNDFQYRIRYDEDWLRNNISLEKDQQVEPIYGTDYSKMTWYFDINEIPGIMGQFIPPLGRSDRKELAEEYHFDINDEFNYIALGGGTGPTSVLQVCALRDAVLPNQLRYNTDVNTYE